MNNVQTWFANFLAVPLIYDKWINLNCQSCTRHGQPRNDTRRRGAFRFSVDGSVAYHCFNCGAKAFYAPGFDASNTLLDLMRDLHADNEDILNLILEIKKLKSTAPQEIKKEQIKFIPRDLPSGSRLITDVVNDEKLTPAFINVIEYLYKRNECLLDVFDIYWCNSSENNLKNRFILPFYMNGKIVGYTARSRFDSDTMKYLNQYPSNLLYNYDILSDKTIDTVYVTEGPIDAGLIGGVAVCNFQFKPEHIKALNNSGKKIVVVPDRDKNGKQMVQQAIELGYSVSFPEYDEYTIHDIEEATRKYGRLFVMYLITRSIFNDEFSIKVKMNQWF